MRQVRIRSVLIAVVCLALCGQVLVASAQFCLPASQSGEVSAMLSSGRHHTSHSMSSNMMSSKMADSPMDMEHHQDSDAHPCCASGTGCSMVMCAVVALPSLDYAFSSVRAAHPPYADLDVVAPELKTSSLDKPPILA